jgi:hypothetical protein
VESSKAPLSVELLALTEVTVLTEARSRSMTGESDATPEWPHSFAGSTEPDSNIDPRLHLHGGWARGRDSPLLGNRGGVGIQLTMAGPARNSYWSDVTAGPPEGSNTNRGKIRKLSLSAPENSFRLTR